jgi:hypothetical protein
MEEKMMTLLLDRRMAYESTGWGISGEIASVAEQGALSSHRSKYSDDVTSGLADGRGMHKLYILTAHARLARAKLPIPRHSSRDGTYFSTKTP